LLGDHSTSRLPEIECTFLHVWSSVWSSAWRGSTADEFRATFYIHIYIPCATCPPMPVRTPLSPSVMFASFALLPG
jgi:hypothetical protein